MFNGVRDQGQKDLRSLSAVALVMVEWCAGSESARHETSVGCCTGSYLGVCGLESARYESPVCRG